MERRYAAEAMAGIVNDVSWRPCGRALHAGVVPVSARVRRRQS